MIGAGVCRIVVYHPRKNDDRKLLHYHRCEPGREDLNLLVSLLSSAARPIDEPLERGPCNFCLFFSNNDDECRVVLLLVLLPIFGDRELFHGNL